MRIGAAFLLGIALVTACGRERTPAGDSAAVPTPAPALAAAAGADSAPAAGPPKAPVAPNVSTCVSEGEWQACSVEKRLTDAGFVPLRKGAAPGGVFDVPGTTYALGPAELHVYLFRTAGEREAAVARIDTGAVVRRGATAPWSMAPTLITSNNLAAVLLSDNGRLIERVQNAITGGLPSASR